MLFTSFEFIFLFLPFAVIGYYLMYRYAGAKAGTLWMIFSSLFFYGWWNPFYVPLLIGSLLINFWLGRRIEVVRGKKKRGWLILGVGFDLSLLGFFKYSDFFIENLNLLTKADVPLFQLALPLGISFFTFQQIAYLVDVYRGETKNMNVWHYLYFVTLFPHLLAGPIVHHADIIPQVEERSHGHIKEENIQKAIFLFSIGLFKKVVVADSLAIWANQGYGHPQDLSFLEAWVTTLSYTFQLYFDFSGYSDMAMSIALLFGIVIPVNFRSPYRSLDIQDFWRRWHITLGRFFTRYLYIPLGGNRKGEGKTYRNLFMVFLASGLWHGAGWTFVCWGALHGSAILLHRAWKKKGRRLPGFLAWGLTFLFVHLAWVLFRAETFTDAILVYRSLFDVGKNMYQYTFVTNGNPVLSIVDVVPHPSVYSLLILFIILFLCVLKVRDSVALLEGFHPNRLYRYWTVILLVSVVYLIFNARSTSEFLYFNF